MLFKMFLFKWPCKIIVNNLHDRLRPAILRFKVVQIEDSGAFLPEMNKWLVQR